MDKKINKNINKAKFKETKDLELEKLYVGPNQQRKKIDPKTLKELAESIKKVGLLQPIIVWPDGKGTYEVLAGQRRLAAYNLYLKGETKIRCQILDDSYTALDAKLFSWSENMQRDEPSLEECMDMCTEVYKVYLSEEAVVSKTGIPLRLVKKYVKLERLPDEMIELVQNDDLKLEDTLLAWDIVSEDDGDPQKGIKYARQFAPMTSMKEKQAVTKVAKSNNVSPKKARPMAKKIERQEIKIKLLPHEANSLNNYANTEEVPREMAAYNLVIDGLTKTGFYEDDE